MNLSHQRRLCDTMGYNPSEPSVQARSEIRNCVFIFGTGDADKCRKEIQRHVLDVELPFSHEAIQAGFGTPNSVGHQIDEYLTDTAVISAYVFKFRVVVERMVPTEIQINKYQDFIVSLSSIEKATRMACEMKLGKPSAVFIENHVCFPSKLYLEFRVFYSASFGVIHSRNTLRIWGELNYNR